MNSEEQIRYMERLRYLISDVRPPVILEDESGTDTYDTASIVESKSTNGIVGQKAVSMEMERASSSADTITDYCNSESIKKGFIDPFLEIGREEISCREKTEKLKLYFEKYVSQEIHPNPFASDILDSAKYHRIVRRVVRYFVLRAANDLLILNDDIELNSETLNIALSTMREINQELITRLLTMAGLNQWDIPRIARENCKMAQVDIPYVDIKDDEPIRCCNDNCGCSFESGVDKQAVRRELNYVTMLGDSYDENTFALTKNTNSTLRSNMNVFEADPQLVLICRYHAQFLLHALFFIHMEFNIYQNCLYRLKCAIRGKKLTNIRFSDVVQGIQVDVFRRIEEVYLRKYEQLWMYRQEVNGAEEEEENRTFDLFDRVF